MKLSKLAAKPQLIPLILDDEDTVKEYGEALEFYTWDRQPLDVFMQLSKINDKDQSQMVDIMRTLILDEEGRQVIVGEVTLPTQILIKAIAKLVDTLGKS
jgi:hypothetical protein